MKPHIKTKEAYTAYLNTSVWKKKRQKAIDRDGGRCRLCNSTKRLNVHHRAYPEVWGTEPIEDLITLCGKCHDIFHEGRALSKAQPKASRAPKIPAAIREHNLNHSKLNDKVVKLLHTNGLIPRSFGYTIRECVIIICDAFGISPPKGKGCRSEYIKILSSYLASPDDPFEDNRVDSLTQTFHAIVQIC
jgi:hypothetical protein